MQLDELHVTCSIDLAPIRGDIGASRPGRPYLDELHCIEALPFCDIVWRGELQFSPIVGADCFRRP